MDTLFISGSIKIRHLSIDFEDRIRAAVDRGENILVGDAGGSDTSIQEILLDCSAPKVTIYCSGREPRNNLGSWPVNSVLSSAPEGTRSYFAAKDVQMADDASCGLMVWDAASTGTLSNVFELAYRGKKSSVFVNKLKRFFPIEGSEDIAALVEVMSPGAFHKADQKIGIWKKLEKLNPAQASMDF